MTSFARIHDIKPEHIRLRRADTHDCSALADLLNRCYRGNEGWINESGLMDGVRTTVTEMHEIIKTDKSYVFVFEPIINGDKQILACIGVQFITMHDKSVAYIGTFAVVPELQGKGVGNTLLSAVETFARRHARSHHLDGLAMSVLSHRPELLAYYERRGYEMTEHSADFPKDDNHGIIKQHDLMLHWLFKPI